MTSKRLLSLTLLALAAAAPASAAPPELASTPPPIPVPLSVSVDGELVWRLDDHYRIFSRDRAAGGGGVSALLDVRRLAGGMLVAGLGFHSAKAESDGDQVQVANSVGRRYQTHLQTQTLSASALLRWTVKPWLEPHLRLAADCTWSRLAVTMSDVVLDDRDDWAPGASAGAGFRLRTPATRTALWGGRLALAGAVMVEGGFHFGRALTFDLTRKRPADDKVAGDQIPGPSVPVGSLGRSHPYLRISIALLI